MKRHLLIALAVVASLCVGQTILKAQNTTTAADVETFFKTTTYIVLDNNPMTEWNMKIEDAAKNHWHITPYKFIKEKANYIFFTVVLGAAVRDMTDMPEICSVPLGYESADQDSWAYKLGSLFQFAQKHIELLRSKPELLGQNVFQYYNKNIAELGDKEIWVVESDLAPEMRSLAAIRKVYDGVVRIVTPDDIEKAVNERREDVVYLHKVGPERSGIKARIYKCLIGAGDDKFYYFDYHMMSKKKGDGMLKDDFRRLNR